MSSDSPAGRTAGPERVWALLGASGFIGSSLAAVLTRAGITVRFVKAPRLSARSLNAPGILAEAADLRYVRQDLAAELAGADVVINAAGLATPTGADSSELRGANALLPVLIADAADDAGARRFIHLSSAAVQGHRPLLDESTGTEPFSAYSRSKALGEAALGARARGKCAVTSLRATSVQGISRQTTASLVRVASTPLSSVAGRGESPSPVSSVDALCGLVLAAGRYSGSVPPVILQPWEGATVASVLSAAGGRSPLHLPVWLCRTALRTGYLVSGLLGERLHGALRRVEMMWFGQRQEPGWAEATGNVPEPRVHQVLEAARKTA
ncbi:NAD-dependent epimerase/dehydratase family protein [Arthrobacter gandavensis]|uniref:NAD-dependent epimerase/dehydratase family protein n=1 Tax=Arthrobacter gandavensis TaxID=169960 RepID=UPI00188EB6D6|nr:NAD-dependent epimerase/dehydratase family protein [Arthrobacter gandavensis]MBF4993575.1 NAD-dependent epimerase/dehydratase family protein [Arthrobacter gandavensis]